MSPLLVALLLPMFVITIPVVYLLAYVPGLDTYYISKEFFFITLTGLVGCIGALVTGIRGQAGAEIWLISMTVLWSIITTISCWMAVRRGPKDNAQFWDEQDLSLPPASVESARDAAFETILNDPHGICDLILHAISCFSVSRVYLWQDLNEIVKAMDVFIERIAQSALSDSKMDGSIHDSTPRPVSSLTMDDQALVLLDQVQHLLAQLYQEYLSPDALYAITTSDLSPQTHLKLNRLALKDAQPGTNRNVHWWLRARPGGDVVVRGLVQQAADELQRRMCVQYDIHH